MKKTFFILITFFFLVSCGEDPAISSAFSKYSGHSEIVSITVPGFIIKAAVAFGDLEKEEKDLLRSIDKVKVLAVDNNRIKGINFKKEFTALTKNGSYSELLSVNDHHEKVKILAKMEGKERITDLVVFVEGDDNALVYVKGDFTMNQIAKVANKGQAESFIDLVDF